MTAPGNAGRGPAAPVEIVFDARCPACELYFRLQRLQDCGLAVRFIDARTHPEEVLRYAHQGIDLDRDFVLRVGGAEYAGADAAHVLASLGARSGLARRINHLLFRSPAVSRLVYPVLRGCRRLLLRLLGRPAIRAAEPD